MNPEHNSSNFETSRPRTSDIIAPPTPATEQHRLDASEAAKKRTQDIAEARQMMVQYHQERIERTLAATTPASAPRESQLQTPTAEPITGPFAKTRQRWRDFKSEHPRAYSALKTAKFVLLDLPTELLGHRLPLPGNESEITKRFNAAEARRLERKRRGNQE